MADVKAGVITSGNNASNSTSHTVTLPTGRVTGELCIIAFSNDGDATASATGWTQINTAVSGTANRITLLQRVLTGAEASTVTVTTSGSEMSAWAVYTVRNYNTIVNATASVTSDTTVTTSSVNPGTTNGQPMYIANVGWDGNVAFSAYGSGLYSLLRANNRSANTNGAGVATNAYVTNSSPETPASPAIASVEQMAAVSLGISAVADAGAAGTTASVTGSASYSDTSAVTSRNITLPASIASGELLILLVQVRDLATDVTLSGWSKQFYLAENSAGTSSLACFTKTATGSEGSTVAFDTVGARYVNAICYRVSNWQGSVFSATAESNGTSGQPNSPALVGQNDSETALIFSVYAWHGNVAHTSYPSGYTGNQVTTRYANSASGGIAAATQAVETKVGREIDPGAATIASNALWVAATIGVRYQAPAAPQTQHPLYWAFP